MRRVLLILRRPMFLVWAGFTTGWTLGRADGMVPWIVMLVALCAGFLAGVWADWDKD